MYNMFPNSTRLHVFQVFSHSLPSFKFNLELFVYPINIGILISLTNRISFHSQNILYNQIILTKLPSLNLKNTF